MTTAPNALIGYSTHVAHHGGQDDEGGADLRPEPVGRLDVLILFKDRIVEGEFFPDILGVTTATDGTLDLLLKLWAGPLLQ